MKIKRIILLGVFFLFMLAPKVLIQASSDNSIEKPLVVKIGSNINEYINYENYVIISNQININKEGTYNIVYENLETKEQITKKVYVTNSDKTSIETNYVNLGEELGTYEYVKSVNYQDEVATLIKFQLDGKTKSSYYLRFGHNSYTIRQSTKIGLYDLYEEEEEFFMVGYGPNVINGDVDLCYASFSKEKGSNYQTITSVGKEEATCVAGNKKYFFIAGKTNETTELFPEERFGYDAFLLTIDRTTNEIVKKTLFPLETDEAIVDMLFLNNYLYAILETSEQDFRLLKLDIFGNIISEKEFNFQYGYKNLHLKKYHNQAYLSYTYYDYLFLDDVSVVKEMDDNLKLTEIKTIKTPGLVLVDFEILDNKRISLLYKNNYQNYGYTYRLIEDNEILLEHTSDLKGSVNSLNNNYISMSYNKRISIIKLDTVIIKEHIKEVFDPKAMYDVESNYLILINGKEVKHSTLSKLEYNKELFGKYALDYYFCEDVEYLQSITLDYLPFVGVIDNGVYDQKVTLDGNAKVRVNGEIVELPYSISEIGKHKIELLGQDNALKTLNIEVAVLSNNNLVENITESTRVLPGSNQIEQEIDLSFKTIQKENNSNNLFYLYLVPLISIGIGFILIKRG